MVTVAERSSAAIILAAALLLWPAFWNGYPLVFSDTGTYLSQAIEHYVGWDRPIFYSLFVLPLHLTLTTWPIVAAQAVLTAHTLHLLRRTLLPELSVWRLLPLVAMLAAFTSLPWFVAQIMPDFLTGLLVLTLAMLALVPARLSRRERIWLTMFATFMIAAHQSHLLLALTLLCVLLPLHRGWRRIVLPLGMAAVALVAVNMIAFGRASLSPYGNVFLLARVISDGPGADVLRRDCPAAGWRLCAFVDRLPLTADDFLWPQDGPVVLAGGAKLVSAEADAIILAALRAEPGTELRAALDNAMHQLEQFASGDGLQPWPATVAPWLQRDFPSHEFAAYTQARQTRGELHVPAWLLAAHTVMAVTGVAGCILLLMKRRNHAVAGFAAIVLLAVVANAAITGGLSMPHDRYQSRVMWLPLLITLLGTASLRRRYITR